MRVKKKMRRTYVLVFFEGFLPAGEHHMAYANFQGLIVFRRRGAGAPKTARFLRRLLNYSEDSCTFCNVFFKTWPDIFKKTILTLLALRFKPNCLNQTCISLKLTILILQPPFRKRGWKSIVAKNKFLWCKKAYHMINHYHDSIPTQKNYMRHRYTHHPGTCFQFFPSNQYQGSSSSIIL